MSHTTKEQPLISESFIKNGQLWEFLNDMAAVHDRELARKCAIRTEEKPQTNHFFYDIRL